ncbi:MAG: glutathione S-transferase family protein [Rhodospirillales bacterium]|nr:glutathione S-transferase family protein [Rhodospirillales bacterium]
MIDLYGTFSPNVFKVALMLEEIGRPYAVHPIRVMQNENLEPPFLALNPIGKVPVIVDHNGSGQPIFESGAILIYLAETYGPAFLPAKGHARYVVLEWLMVQMSLVGPMLGQLNHFQLLPSESDTYAFHRYRDQAARAYRNLEQRLSAAPWIGGDEYSIADIAVYPWSAYLSRHGFDGADFPKLMSWRDRIDRRPAAQALVSIGAKLAAQSASKPVTGQQFDRFFSRSAPGPAVDLAAYVELGPMITARD